MPKKNPSLWYQILISWPFHILFFVLRMSFLAGIVIAGWFVLQTIGILTVKVPVTGASMLPTLPEEGSVPFQRYYHNKAFEKIIPQSIQKGDIVVFENEKTHKELEKQDKDVTGFVKRVIAIQGDVVVIKDGFVYVNGQKKQEQYTLKPRSTFGGTEIQDCKPIKVPEDKVVVLGDNRKISMDSRQIGFVSIADILFYIPFEKQEEQYGLKWRDAGHDFDTEHESLFDIDLYLKLLNNERVQHDLDALNYQIKLEQSAKRRAETMLSYNEFDSKASKSGYTMKDAMNDVGYSNIVYGEFPMLGYYDAEELFDAFLEQPGARDFLLNEDYDEIGVSTFVGELNKCPVQVVVQHLAGYIPPNYGSGEIASFKEAIDRLKEIGPGWQRLTSYQEFYQQNKADVDRMNEIITIRISRFEQIEKQMEANKWLTKEQNQWIKDDEQLSQEQNQIADKLNKQ
ncbi:MAG: Signal peptidase I [Candidatus Roizmanbacteria bacterium GW2011_GWA2_37_7]|uniref:Signal peptidase I n=1 Tax=Candidatus Roizmanbacteria bacterium GW2011_GWA2_37_7 TaxID=1618481 RepID=A0A0G0JPR0_9BACT|nr:MAG: Signal peptidase I [Candidatus Roizmanbacteria bacterium GW2011_GWA2_37_7]